MGTYMAKHGEVEKKWWVIDADGKVLGRLATQVARILMGKNKPVMTKHIDTGDFVIVVNAGKVVLTGDKWNKKMYYRASGWHSGLKEIPAWKLREKKPEDLVKFAVMGMLPKNKSRKRLLKKLKIYAGAEHPHSSQKPEPLKV